jgi:bifunctional DNA-binding transcriptional regulator/antitoxin component of YhaV-PrlF toxin-antitoxin module
MAPSIRVRLRPLGDDTLVVLPPEVLDRLGVSEGGKVVATEEDGGLTLRPLQPDPLEPEADE